MRVSVLFAYPILLFHASKVGIEINRTECGVSSPKLKLRGFYAAFDKARSMLDFVKVAEVDDLDEGELMAIDVDGEPVCLAKVNNSIYAFTDNCTHISGPLNEGELEGEVLTCPWHGAQFNVCTGKVLRGPARQDIQTYQVRVEGNSILLSLPDEL